MINLKKIAAVTLATAMCMGLSMTAFATTLPNQDNAAANGTDRADAANSLSGTENFNRINSPYLVDTVENGLPDTARTTVETTNGKGEQNDQLTLDAHGIDPGSVAWNSVNTKEEIADILSENGIVVPQGSKVIAIGAAVVDGLSDEQKNVLVFTLSNDDFTTDPYDNTKLHPGEEAWAMVETGPNTGVWEMRSGIIDGDGKVNFEVDHKGAIILVKAMKNGRIVKFEKDSNGNDVKPPVVIDPENPGTNVTPGGNQGTSTTPAAGAATTGTSPKTGEF